MPSFLNTKRILLVISGGIAAYKSLDLIRKFKEEGATVRCVLTQSATQFVTPLSVSALSGEPVFTSLFSLESEQKIGHIQLSRETDLIVVAPATANLLAKMTHGLADDLASAVLLASNKPILVAPAMNYQMWQNPATQDNMARLKSRGVHQVGPAAGKMACGEEGTGRLAEINDILAAATIIFSASKPLAGRRALVTSGPTFEPLDPVRFIGNRSSGKQGHAVAAALADLGADVTLVTGPVALPPPDGVRTVAVETAREMLEACLSVGGVDVAVCAAAVADWRPDTCAENKIKKENGARAPQLSLTENPDILATLSGLQDGTRPKLVIGFAAETHDLLANAAAKFARKGCDWIVANHVGDGIGFGQENNQVLLFQAQQEQPEAWPSMTKKAVAEKLAAYIVHSFEGKDR
ncbi:MAG: bifunctional phosphopantothenoylcysteine decarboxylase/phosphopantothenate--cysteine ligase CoaBC [Bdellovibrionales bacterium]